MLETFSNSTVSDTETSKTSNNDLKQELDQKLNSNSDVLEKYEKMTTQDHSLSSRIFKEKIPKDTLKNTDPISDLDSICFNESNPGSDVLGTAITVFESVTK